MANPLIYHKQGWIEVICGCMFSGKTEELIRRVRTALIAKQKVQLFNSKIDTLSLIHISEPTRPY